ncbi:MAG: hypothetical protein AB1861_14690 [Cyanobacteriota bacterium]
MKSVQLEAIASVSKIGWERTEACIPIVATNSLGAFTRLGDSKYSQQNCWHQRPNSETLQCANRALRRVFAGI